MATVWRKSINRIIALVLAVLLCMPGIVPNRTAAAAADVDWQLILNGSNLNGSITKFVLDRDDGIFYALTVYQNRPYVWVYTGVEWEQVGDNLSGTNGVVTVIDMAVHQGTIYVGVATPTEFIVVVKRPGEDWKQLGNLFGTIPEQPTRVSISIDPAGIPYLGYISSEDNRKPKVLKWNGASWTPVSFGNDLPTRQAFEFKLATDQGQAYMAIKNSVLFNEKLSVQSIGGTMSSSPVSRGGVPKFDLASYKGVPYAAFADDGGNTVVLKRYVGGSWQTMGERTLPTNQYVGDISVFVDDSGAYVFYKDNQASKGYVLQSTGSGFQQIGRDIYGIGSTDLSILRDEGVLYIGHHTLVEKYGTETTPPVSTKLFPQIGATNVNPDTNLEMTFSEVVKPSYDNKNLKIRKWDTDEIVATIPLVQAKFAPKKVTVNPPNDLDYNTRYYVELETGSLLDLNDNPYAGMAAKTWHFTTGADVYPPTLTSFTPAKGATNVPQKPTLTMNFSESVVGAAGKNIEIRKFSNGELAEQIPATDLQRVEISGSTVLVKPSSTLLQETNFYVTVESGAFKDKAGNAYAGLTDKNSWNFYTMKDVYPPLAASFTPEKGATDAPLDFKLKLKFDENVKAATKPGVYGVVQLYEETAVGSALLEEFYVNTPSQVSITGDTAVMVPTKPIKNNTNYNVKVSTNAFQDNYGNLFAGIHDSITWTFKTVKDTKPPVMVQLSPVDDGQDISLTASLSIVFDEEIVPATQGKFTVKRSSDDSVVEQIDLSDLTKIMYFGKGIGTDLSEPLDYNTEYYVQISPNALKDGDSNGYGGITDKTTWNFKTVRDYSPPQLKALSPANGGKEVAYDAELSMTFDEKVKAGTGYFKIMNSKDDQLVEKIAVSSNQVTITGSKVSIKPSKPFVSNGSYYVLVDDDTLLDFSGNNYYGLEAKNQWSFDAIKDTTKPTIIAFTPVDNETDVPVVNTELTIKFSEPVIKDNGYILIHEYDTGRIIQQIKSSELTVSNDSVTIPLTERLGFGVHYYVTVQEESFKDSGGNHVVPLTNKGVWDFYTEFEVSKPISRILATPGFVTADGQDYSEIKVTVTDYRAHPLKGKTVVLEPDKGSSTIEAVQAVTDEWGQAVFRVRNKVVEDIIYSASVKTSYGTIELPEKGAVSFRAGPVSEDASTVTATPTSVTADGASVSTIVVQLKDAFGHPLPGQQVSLQDGGGSSWINYDQPVTDANGRAVFTVRNSLAEQVTYSAETHWVKVKQRAKVTFEAPIPGASKAKTSVLQSRVSADPLIVKANGQEVSTITVTLKDSSGQPIAGNKVSLSQGSGSSAITAVREVSDSAGQAVFTVRSSKAEQVTYTVKDETDKVTLAEQAVVTFVTEAVGGGGTPQAHVLKSTMVATPTMTTANGRDFSVLTVTLRDHVGQPISGKKVSLSADGGSSVLTAVRDTTGADGEAVFKALDVVPEPVTYTARIEADGVTLAQKATVVFESAAGGTPGVPTVSVMKSSVTASPTVVSADGTAKAVITVKLLDTDARPVSGRKVVLTQNGSSAIASVQDISDGSGVARFTASSSTAEPVTYTARLESGETLAQRAKVTFEHAPAGPGGSKTSVLDSTVIAVPGTVAADGTEASEVTVTLLNGMGEPITGKTVSLSADGGSSTITAKNGKVSDANGRVIFLVTNRATEQVTYTAKDETDGITVAQRTIVTFETPGVGAGGISVLKSSVNAVPDTVLANGTEASTITVTLRDAAGLPVAGKKVSMKADGGSSILTPVQDTSDADGKAQFKATNMSAEQVTYSARVEADGATIAQRAKVTFESAAASPGGPGVPGGPVISVFDSTLVASPDIVKADGAEHSTITVTLKNSAGDPIAGKTVKLAANGGSSLINAAGGAVSDAQGRASFTVSNTAAEQVTYTARVEADGVTLVQRATVTFEKAAAGGTGTPAVSVVNSTVNAAPALVAANGVSYSTVTVALKDTGNNPVANKKVSLSANGGSSVIESVRDVSDAQGLALFRVKDSQAEQVTYTARVEADGVTLAQRAAVVFEYAVPGEDQPRASVLKSAVTAAPAKVTANGTDASTLTVVLKDTNGAPLAGKAVTLAAESARALISTVNGVTDAQGVALFKAKNFYAEQVVFTASVPSDSVTVAQRAMVVFETAASGNPQAPAISIVKSTVAAAPETVVADGVEASTVTVTLKDANGAAIAGKTVTLKANSGESVIVSKSGGVTAADGRTEFTVTSEAAGQVTYTAYVAADGVTVAQRVTVTFETPEDNSGSEVPAVSVQKSIVTAAPAVVTANGASFSTITVTLEDGSGAAVAGKMVTLSADGGSSVIAAIRSVSDDQGKTLFTVRNIAAEQVTYTAHITSDRITLAQRTIVTFEAAAGGASVDPVISVLDSTVIAEPETVKADGIQPSIITVTLKNSSGQPIVGKTVTLSVSTGSSVITAKDGGVTDSNGRAEFTVTSATAGQVFYTAKVASDSLTLTQRAAVTFETSDGGGTGSPAVSVLKSTISAAPEMVAAGGRDASVILVSLKDSSGAVIEGKTVTLTASNGQSVITPIGGGISDTNGEARFKVTNMKAEQVTFTAAVSGVTLAKTVKVTFETEQSLPVISIMQSSVLASPSQVKADGLEYSTITVTLKDGNGAPIGGKEVTITPDGGSSIITPINGGISGAGGTALFRVTNTAAEQVNYTAQVTADRVKIAQRAAVTFEATAPAGSGSGRVSALKSTMNAEPIVNVADGVSASFIKVWLKDTAGSPVEGKKVSLTKSPASSVISAVYGDISDAAGMVLFRVTNTTAGQVIYTASVATDNTTLVQTATVTFEKPAVGGPDSPYVSVMRSAATATPEKVTADGKDVSTIRVTLLDASGRPVSGKTVSLFAGGSSVIQAVYGGVSRENGVAQFLVTNTAAEQVAYTALVAADGITLAQRATVSFETKAGGAVEQPSVSLLKSSIAASPSTLPANGTSSATVTVTLKDANGRPVTGKQVKLTQDGASLIEPQNGALSDAQGIAVFKVKSLIAGQVTYAASADNVTLAQTAVVTFQTVSASGTPVASVTRSTVTASPERVTADGSSYSVVTVTLRNAVGYPVASKTVQLKADGGNSVITSLNGGVSDEYGQVFFRVKNAFAEQVIYSAKEMIDNVGIAQTATVTFLANAGSGTSVTSVTRSTIVASPDKVAADGVSYSTITVVLRNTNGQPVSGKKVQLTAVGGSSSIVPLNEGTSNLSGEASFQVRNANPEQVTYRAKDITDQVSIAQSAVVTYLANAGTGGQTTSVARSSMTASPLSIIANGTEMSTITVTLRNANGQPVSGKTVKLSASSGSSVVDTIQAVSNERGQAVFKVKNSIVEQVTYTAVDETDRVRIAETATVTFKPIPQKSRPLDPELIEAEADKEQVTVNNVLPGTKVTVYDKDGNVIGEGTNPGPGSGPVVIQIPGIKEGDTLKLTATEPDKTESDKVNEIVRKDRGTSAPVPPEKVSADPEKDEIMVSDVPPGTKVTIYDKDGTIIGEGTNPGPGEGPIIIRVPGLKEGDIVKLTATEPGKKESGPVEKTIEMTTDPIDPVKIAADPEADMISVRDVEPGKKIKVYDKNGNVIGEGTNPGPGVGPVMIPVPGLKEGDIIKLTATEPGKKESVPTSKTVTIYDTVSRPIDPVKIKPDPDKDEVTVQDVLPGTKITIYDKNGTIIGEGTNPGPGVGPIVISVPGLKEGDIIKLTATEPDKKESDPTSKMVKTVSSPLDPDKVWTDPVKDEVTVRDVPPGTKITIYDKDGTIIGEGTNPGPGTGPVIIRVPGLKEGDVIKLTVTEPGMKESGSVEKTVEMTTDPLDSDKIAANPEEDKVTVRDVEPGKKIKVYDKNGNVIGEGTNPGPGVGPVVISLPGLKEGDVIKLTATEPGKKESVPTSKTVTIYDTVTRPINPDKVKPDPDLDEVTVQDVPPGTKITIYDKDGTIIGEGTNPGPGTGPIVIRVPGLKEGDVIKLTASEPGKKESVPASVPVPGKPMYEVEAEADDHSVTVVVTPKPGTNPSFDFAYVVVQGMRNSVPVYVLSEKINAKHPQPFRMELKHAQAGDKLHIVIVSMPDNARSDVGYSLSDEVTESVVLR
ncbi:hypothetical protein GC093_23295 [Paenibacillus sp. LMG 31456]|uniref:Big-1 domain-containing protein n=1 Tax=Paenibacillus foliorum TaxID=2654974 RepID=A0A972K4L2_9BACL|nr:Ig-like domain-containing protein [Paenibacillus foliorum]NOU96127.1 hypothetical protein [Paenibacillus foliorum]